MLTVRLVDSGNGCVGPNHAVATQDNAWVRHAVAAQGASLTKQRPELPKPTRNPLTVHSKVNFSSVVA